MVTAFCLAAPILIKFANASKLHQCYKNMHEYAVVFFSVAVVLVHQCSFSRFTGPKNHKLLKCICTKSNNPHNFRYALRLNLHIVWIYLIPIYSVRQYIISRKYLGCRLVADVSVRCVMHLTRLYDPVNHLELGWRNVQLAKSMKHMKCYRKSYAVSTKTSSHAHKHAHIRHWRRGKNNLVNIRLKW